MKRMKRNLVYIALLVMLLVMLSLITACGSGVNLSASMSGVNESEEASAAVEEDEETAETEDYDAEDVDFDEDNDEESDEWAEDSDEDAVDTDEAEGDSAVDGNTITVVLNTNKDRKRIHLLDTSCAGQIHAENYQESTGTEQELIDFANEYGYVACGRCHPDTKLGIDLP